MMMVMMMLFWYLTPYVVSDSDADRSGVDTFFWRLISLLGVIRIVVLGVMIPYKSVMIKRWLVYTHCLMLTDRPLRSLHK